ncbi:hypothetical protein [Thalassobellus citreus]|uniref:hypothetical protein n=1 Tax=Thalassobellus citreus TaxID=3367752 RepID=UPI0037AD02FF
MKVEKNEVLKVVLKNNDANNFKEVVKQICDPQIGFSKANISKEQLKTMNNINDKL